MSAVFVTEGAPAETTEPAATQPAATQPGAARSDVIEDFTGSWTLQPNRSSVTVKTRSMWGLIRVRGTFTSVRGTGTLDPDGVVRGSVTIGAASLDTGIDRRDAHLRSADFLDVETFPEVVLTVTGVIGADMTNAELADAARTGDRTTALVEGTLEVVGGSLPVSFPAAVEFAGNNAFVDATLTVDRSAFGLTWNRLGFASSMNNLITAHLTFSRA
jgi:polyisoprenoid-binding protein YceI